MNRTKVRRACQPKTKKVNTNKGVMRFRLKSKNADPEYSRQGTRAKGKFYKPVGEQDFD